jgi:transcriptional regulator with XRE-family HTH domain
MRIEENILELRKNNNLSQEDLAVKMGVSRQSVSKWETGQSAPDLKNIIKLSEIFNITVDELIKDKDSIEGIEELNSTEDGNKNHYSQSNKTMGAIFMTTGVLIVILSLILTPLAILVGIPVFIIGMEVVLLTKHVKLVVAWTVFFCLTIIFNPWMTSVPTTRGLIYCFAHGIFSFSVIISIIQNILGIILLIITIRMIKKNKKLKYTKNE